MRQRFALAWVLLPWLAACSVRSPDTADPDAPGTSATGSGGALAAPSGGSGSQVGQGAGGAQPAAQSGASAAGAPAGGASAESDASAPSEPRPLPMTDAGASTDAGAPACAIPGLEDQHCKGQICTVDGDPFLWLTKDTRFQVGALNWVATVCEEPLSGPNGASNDGVDMLWGLSLKQLRALRAGVEVRVFYGTASDAPQQFPPETQACTLELATPLPTCPEDLGDPDHRPTHVSKSGCRGPLDDYCAVCKEYPWGPTETSTWSSASGGADWYNVTSPLFPATTCTTECPACARCSYRDEEQANALPARPECLPCPAGPALDPCFSPDSCDCWCASYTRLSEDCPTVLEE